jgi:UDP-N-acetyl-2-amino-2-deoxyglucuronate dehydrogenase
VNLAPPSSLSPRSFSTPASPAVIAVGLVGCGDVARRYATALDGSMVPGLRLTCVSDQAAAAAHSFGGTFDLRVLPSLPALLHEPIGLVCVCTPNATHAAVARECLRAGKHVLLEHPMAMTTAEADDLIAVAAQTGRQLFVMRQRRYLKTIQVLRAALQEGYLGLLRDVQLSLCWNRTAAYFSEKPWRAARANGGVIVNQASHFLDLLLYLFGDPVSLEGWLGTALHPVAGEDSAFGRIHFDRVSASIECTITAPPGHNRATLRVIGSAGELELGGSALERFSGDLPAAFRSLEARFAGPLPGDHTAFLQRVGQRLTGGSPEVVDATEGRRAVQLIDAIYRDFTRSDEKVREHFGRAFRPAPLPIGA